MKAHVHNEDTATAPRPYFLERFDELRQSLDKMAAALVQNSVEDMRRSMDTMQEVVDNMGRALFGAGEDADEGGGEDGD